MQGSEVCAGDQESLKSVQALGIIYIEQGSEISEVCAGIRNP